MSNSLVKPKDQILDQLEYYRDNHTVSDNIQICCELVSRYISDLEIKNKVSLIEINSRQYSFLVVFLVERLTDIIYDRCLFQADFIQTLINLFGEKMIDKKKKKELLTNE